MIFKQETIKSWFTGVGSSINNEVVQPFKNANSIISKYNLAIQHNSLTQQGWQRLLAQSDDSLKAYLTSIKGTTASMAGYNVSLQGNITGFTKITKAMQQYNALGATSQKEQQAFATAVGATNTKLGSYLTGLNGAKASLSGYGLSLIASTAKTIGLTVATTALNATLTMGISLIVSGLISAFVSWIHKSEEITKKAQEAADKINSINDSLKSNTETVENAKKRYAELAQEVENLGKITQSKGTLSNEEYEEFLDLSNQLAGIFPSLTKNYDENGNTILDLSGDVNTIVGSLDSLIQKEKELANQKIMEEFPDVFKGWNQDLSNAEQKVKSAKTEFDKINQAYNALGKGQSIQMGFNVNGSNVDSNGNITIMRQYISWLETLGLTYEEMSVQGGHVVTAVGDIDVAFTSKLEEARENLQYAQQQLEGQTSSINQYLNTWLQGEFSYIQVEDSGLQTAIQDMLFNFDWDNIPEDKRGDWNYVSEYLRRNILFEINKVQNDPIISKAISEIFTNTELTPNEKANYLKQIQDYFGEDNAVVISLTPQIEETETLQKQYDKAIEDTKKKFDGYDPTAFFKEHSINTQEEIDAWQKIAQGARDAAEAEKKYIQGSALNKNPFSFDQAWADSFTSENGEVRELGNTHLELAVKGRLTVDTFNEADSTDYFKGLGISADEAVLKINKLVDASSQLSSMSSQLSSMAEALGTKSENGFVKADTLSGFDVKVRSLESWGHFQETLGSTTSSYQECEEAANALATEWVNSSDFLAQLTDQNKEYYATQLQAMGVENYEEVTSYAQALNEAKEVLSQSSLGFGDATQDEIESLIAEGAYLGLTADLILALYDAKVSEQAATLDTSTDCENLIALAGDTDRTSRSIQLLTQLMDIYNGLESGAYDGNRLLREEALAEVNRIKGELEGLANGEMQDFPIEPTVKLGVNRRSGAKSAGKEAAATYLEAFEKELKDLDDLKSRGKITEKQYLDALRRLYLKYFRDKEEYLKEYEKYEHQYLDDMKSLYESAFSYITKQVDSRIDTINAEKDAAVSALEAERDARLEAIEAQKGQLENEIEGIEKEIETKEKEIKAMQDANGERKRAIDLQKAEYDLQRMQNQKASLVYKDGQVSYEADTSGIRDAKQEVEDAKLEIDISKIEKEIGLLEEQKGLLQEQIDLLDQEADRVNDYYDKLIAGTEKQYDAMVKGMEQYKSQFEELLELSENARLEATLSELGINMDALLNGSQEEFEKMKGAYIGILADMNRGNDEIIGQLSRLAGVNAESVSYLESTKGAFENFGAVTLGGLGGSVEDIRESVSGLATSAGEASTAVGNIQKSVSNASQSISPLNTELGNLKTLIGELIALLNGIAFPEISDEGYAQKLRGIAQAFGEIASKCGEFKKINFSSIIGSASAPSTDGAVMSGGEGMEGTAGTGFLGLVSAISEAVASIDEQMGKLKTALDLGNSYFMGQIDVINEKYIPAWENLRTCLAEIIGVGGGDSEDKKGRGKQETGSTDSGSASGGKSGSIIDIMQTGGDEVAKKLKDPWLKAFNDFATDGDNSIQTICDKIIGLVTEMARVIQEKCKAAAAALDTLASKAASSPATKGGGGRSRGGYKGTVGNAFAGGTTKIESLPITGYKGIPHDEKNALRSEYGQPELTVYPDGTAELTTEPVISDLPKGTIIFNEEQTRRIMSNKGEMLETYADGTVRRMDGSMVKPDGEVIYPITPDDRLYWMQKKFEGYFRENKGAFIKPAHAMLKTAGPVDKAVEMVNHSNTMNRTEIAIGDIHLHEVQDADRLSDELILRLPNKILQKMHKV